MPEIYVSEHRKSWYWVLKISIQDDDHHKLSCPYLSICHQISFLDPLPGHFLEVSWLLIIFQVNEGNGNMFLICPVFITARRWQRPVAGSASCLG